MSAARDRLDYIEPTTEPGYDIQGHSQGRSSRVCSSSTLKMIAATLCISGAVATWVAMAEALQSLSKEYKSPFFMSYFVHSSYSILYVGWALWRYFPYCTSSSYSCNSAGDGALTNFRSLGIWSGLIAAIAVLAGYTWYLSLTRTNIPANTAIYQCAAAVVFVISVPLLKERVTVLKVLCVLVSIGGVFIVAFFSTDKDNCSPVNNVTNATSFYNNDPCVPEQETSTPLGYVLLLVSVITFALYETFYKKFATKKDDPIPSINGLRVLGYIGVHTMLWMWPPIIILHYTGFEPFQVPPTLELFGLLVLNALMDIVFNGCVLVAIALSSPLYTSVGTIMAIPTSVVVDLIVHHFLPSWQASVGIVVILTGFIGFVISEFREKTLERKHKKSQSLKNATSSRDTSSDSLPEENQPLMSKAETTRQWWPIVARYLI